MMKTSNKRSGIGLRSTRRRIAIRTRCTIFAACSMAALDASRQAWAGDGYFSFQGAFTTSGASQNFTLFPTALGPITASTLHNAGGVNLAGEVVPAGSFNPTLALSGNGYSGFDDDSGPGLDASLVANLPAPSQQYNLLMQPIDPSSVGHWAVDVLGPELQYVSPMLGTGSRIDSVTLGGRNGGSAGIYFSTPGDSINNTVLLQARVTLRDSGFLLVGLLNATDAPAVGSLEGTGYVTLGAATLTVGGNGMSTSYAGNISGDGGLIKTGAGTLSLAGDNTFSGKLQVLGSVLALASDGALPSGATVDIGSQGVFSLNGHAARVQTITGNGTVNLSGGQLTFAHRFFDPNGTSDPEVHFSNPGQLAGDGNIILGEDLRPYHQVGGYSGPDVYIEAANPELKAEITILGYSRLTATTSGALGSSAIGLSGGILRLSATGAAANDIVIDHDTFAGVSGGQLEYNANEAAGGHLVTVSGGRGASPYASANLVIIGQLVTSVGADRFQVSADAALVVNSATSGLFTRGGNLTLDAGAIVGLQNPTSIANLEHIASC